MKTETVKTGNFPPQILTLERFIECAFPESAWQREVLLRMLERIEELERDAKAKAAGE